MLFLSKIEYTRYHLFHFFITKQKKKSINLFKKKLLGLVLISVLENLLYRTEEILCVTLSFVFVPKVLFVKWFFTVDI